MFMRKIILLLLISFNTQAYVINEKNPQEYRSFKSNYSDMIELANETRLPQRVFYTSPSTGRNALWFDAVKHGDLNEVKTMVGNGQDIEVKDTGSLDQTALGWAAFIGDDEMVDYLISQKANLWAGDKDDVCNVLKSAVLGNNAQVVEKIYNLMKNEINLNDQNLDNDGETLLMVAVSYNRIDTVKYLLSQGVDVNLSTTIKDISSSAYNQSALTYACKNNFQEIQDLLIKSGAINHRTGKPSCN